jgi:N-acetylneuraminate synthase
LGNAASILSIGYGATVIERHVVLARKQGGVDAAFSLEPDELKALVRDSKAAWQAQGSVHYGPTSSEKKSLIFRRSLYAVEDIKKGEKLSRANIRAIRPGLGLSPKWIDRVLGRPAKRSITRGTALNWEMV